MQAGTPARSPSYLCAQVKRGPGTRGAGGCPWVPAARGTLQRAAARGDRTRSSPWAQRWGSPRRPGSSARARVVPRAAETCRAPQRGHGAAQSAVTVRQRGGLGWGSELRPPRRPDRSTHLRTPSAAPARSSALGLTFRSCRFSNPTRSGSQRRGEGDCPAPAGCRAAPSPFRARSPFPTALRGPPAQSAGKAAEEAVATTSGQTGQLGHDNQAWKGETGRPGPKSVPHRVSPPLDMNGDFRQLG